MSRLIDTADINNRVQARKDLGIFKISVEHIIMEIVRDCPTAEDKNAVNKTIEAVLQIIDDEGVKLQLGGYGAIPKYYVKCIKDEIEKLRGEE